MWTWIAAISALVLGLVGLLTSTHAELIPRWRWLFVSVFAAFGVASFLATLAQSRESAQQLEAMSAQITGKGGWPRLSVLGWLPTIPGQVINGRAIAEFRLMNDSDTSVFHSRVSVMQLVPQGDGFMGSTSEIHQGGVVAEVHPHDAPTFMFRRPALWLDRPNIFSATIFSRSATFNQKTVVVWKDGAWHEDFEVVQMKDEDRGNEEIVFKRMGDEFRQMLPTAWQ